jgi:hypothetical protein
MGDADLTTRFSSLLSLIFMMGFVMLFDLIHQRNRHYQWLGSLYKGLAGFTSSC